MATSFSRSCASGGGGEEEGAVAGSPPSSMNPSTPAGVLSTSALAGVSPAFLCNSKSVNAPSVSSPAALMVYRSAANHSDLPSLGGRTLTLVLLWFSLDTLVLSFLLP